MERVLAKFGIRSLLLLTTFFVLAQSSFATTAVRPSDDDLIIGARAIVRGKVVSIESALDDSGRIYTYVSIRVQEVIKGQITERRIVLKELGGQVGDRAMAVYGNPQFTRGERVFLYLDTWADGSLRTYQMFLGKFSIVQDPKSGLTFVTREMDNDHVVVLPPRGGDAHGPSTDRMELFAYIEMIRARRAANREASRAFESRFYAGMKLRAQPPEFPGVSSTGEFSTQFTLLGNARWFEPDSGQAVNYIVNPTPSSVPGFPSLSVPSSDVAAAASAWSNVPGCALRVNFGGQQSNCYLITETPGINIVSNNCDGRNGATTSCSGILAWGGWSAGTSETKVINGTAFSRITQGFISFNPYAVCYFDDHCDVQEITTHEMGHALGLSHSGDPDATMFAYAHFDGRCASIRQDDSNGITFIYPGSGGGPAPLSITTSSLPAGTVGSSYSQTLIASGGTTPYSWSLVAGQGTLPAGLNLSTTGIISGTPTTTGTSSFTVKVSDAASGTAQKALSISVTNGGDPLDSQFVSQNVPATLQPGQSFNANLKFLNTGTQTWGGSAFWLVSQNPPQNITWGGNGVSLASYSIAPGQQLDITFTAYAPSTPGTYDFQWQLYQNQGVGYFGQPSTNLSIQVGNSVVITSTSPVPAGTLGTAYSQTLTASGGIAPYSWRVIAGLGSLPGGLSLSTAGVISGTPTSTGTFNFTVQANDSASGSAQKALSLTIAGAPTPVSITTESPLAGGSVGTSYSRTLSALGGTAPYTWSVVAGLGSLPGGLSLSGAGVISGTPSAAGTFSFTIRANDSAAGSAQKAFSITIVSASTGPSIQGPTSLTAIRNSMFSNQLSVSGGRPQFIWTIISGGLPAGIGLNGSSGLISGTPTTLGVSTFTVQVVDADGAKDQKNFTLNVSPAPLLIGDTTVPECEAGSPLTFQLSATGGVAPYRWGVSVGSLPAGVVLNTETGLLSGTPANAGTFNATVIVTDAMAASAMKSLSITVTPSPLKLITSILESAGRFSPYRQNLAASGGVGPYRWSIAEGALPDGLSLDPSTGLISGVPEKNGRFQFMLVLTDQSTVSVDRHLEIVVADSETLPHINTANYKSGSEQLVVKGENFDKKGMLLIDGVQVSARLKAGKANAHDLKLSAGAHAIRVLTRDGVVSNTFVVVVN
ncbi:MAG TPA: putative Ig domain-containing protein [Blastocatellia bacterium]|nr:putative Ig domain-containing protein [Blastocatellia bacterium]